MSSVIPCSRPIGRWDGYYRETCQRPSSALVTEALALAPRRNGQALDLGAGTMNDSALMLESGIFRSVTAVDASAGSPEYAAPLAAKHEGRFDFWNVRFSDFFGQLRLPEHFDLVHSNYGLPYHGKLGFEELMSAALESVRVGGIFSCIFFGEEDDWRKMKPDIPLMSEGAILGLLAGFDLVVPIKETKVDGHLIWGENLCSEEKVTPKFWHTMKVIARRTALVL